MIYRWMRKLGIEKTSDFKKSIPLSIPKKQKLLSIIAMYRKTGAGARVARILGCSREMVRQYLDIAVERGLIDKEELRAIRKEYVVSQGNSPVRLTGYTREEILDLLSRMPSKEAASQLGITMYTFKKLCKFHGIKGKAGRQIIAK